MKESTPYPIGTRVQKTGSSSGTVGRTGVVIEIENLRRRIAWDTEPNGRPIINIRTGLPSIIRTWVNIKSLKLAP